MGTRKVNNMEQKTTWKEKLALAGFIIVGGGMVVAIIILSIQKGTL